MQNNSQQKLDKKQKEIADSCKEIALLISQENLADKIKRMFFVQNKKPRGIYLHGSVGTGKTTLMKIFYDAVTTSKEIIHYQTFMQDVM